MQSYVTVAISGLNAPWKYSEIEALAHAKVLYRKGTDPRLFVEMERSEADLFVVNANNTPGVKADILPY